MTTTTLEWIRNARPTADAKIFAVDLTASDFSDAYDEVGGTRINERQRERFSSSHYQGRQYQVYLEEIFEREGAGGVALDVGSGDGRGMAWLMEHGFEPVIGVDVSLEALRRAATLLPHGEFVLVHGGLLDLKLEPASLDLVTAIESMHYLLDDYEQGAARIAQSLKPGGLFISSEPDWEAGLLYAAMCGDLEALQSLAVRRRTYEHIDDVREVRTSHPAEKSTILRKLGLEEIGRYGVSALPLFLIHLFHRQGENSVEARTSINEALDEVLSHETQFNRLYLTVHRRL